MKELTVYVVAILLVNGIGIVILPLVFLYGLMLSNARTIVSFVPLLFLHVGMEILAVYLIRWTCEGLDVEPVLLMIVIPAILLLVNTVRAVRSGAKGSTVPESVKWDSYDPRLAAQVEIMYAISDFTGLFLGAYWFLGSAPWW